MKDDLDGRIVTHLLKNILLKTTFAMTKLILIRAKIIKVKQHWVRPYLDGFPPGKLKLSNIGLDITWMGDRLGIIEVKQH